jgi:type III pantothenate kinase
VLKKQAWQILANKKYKLKLTLIAESKKYNNIFYNILTRLENNMLLLIDVGNSNIVMGVYDKDVLIKDWRIRTVRESTEDEFYITISSLFKSAGIKPENIEKTVISCVVPPVVRFLDMFCKKYLQLAPLWINADMISIMPILYKNPSEVGADRIVNAIGAYIKYKKSLIIIDFGTATTFDAISEKGEYLGGAISPGIMISSEALFRKASKLPRVEIFQPPTNVIGKDTGESMQSGIIFGYAGLVDGIVKKMKKEMASMPAVIATGGLAALICEVSETIDAVESSLTLEGLKYISNNQKI